MGFSHQLITFHASLVQALVHSGNESKYSDVLLTLYLNQVKPSKRSSECCQCGHFTRQVKTPSHIGSTCLPTLVSLLNSIVGRLVFFLQNTHRNFALLYYVMLCTCVSLQSGIVQRHKRVDFIPIRFTSTRHRRRTALMLNGLGIIPDFIEPLWSRAQTLCAIHRSCWFQFHRLYRYNAGGGAMLRPKWNDRTLAFSRLRLSLQMCVQAKMVCLCYIFFVHTQYAYIGTALKWPKFKWPHQARSRQFRSFACVSPPRPIRSSSRQRSVSLSTTRIPQLTNFKLHYTYM